MIKVTGMDIPLLVFIIMGHAAVPVTTSSQPWPGTTGVDLHGKMFTLSTEAELILTTPSDPTPSDPTPRSTAYPWTQTTPTAPWVKSTTEPWPKPTAMAPPQGVTVCLRYVSENTLKTIFTLSPNSVSSLAFAGSLSNESQLTFSGFSTLDFGSFRPFWSIRSSVWTSVCVTVDTRKGVAQVFRGGSISIRKRLPIRYEWKNELLLQIPGFDGQVTDVEVWDYPISYSDIQSYMNGYNWYDRSPVISWRYISYSPRENALLESSYDRQE